MPDKYTLAILCKNCGSRKTVKYGTYKGIQRYYCNSCKRKFKGDAALFHDKIAPEIKDAAKEMKKQGLTLRAIQSDLKLKFNHTFSTSTIDDWVMPTPKAGKL
jgi:transposase-like protein